MYMYIKLTSGTPAKYTLGQLRRDNPQVSFPKNVPDETLAEYGVYFFTVTERPVIEVNQRATLSEAFTQVDGEWVREWVVRTIAIEELRAGMVCTRLQGRLALGEVEIARLDAFIDGFPNSWALRQVVDNSVTWRRTSQDMEMLGFALDYSPEKMDETFIRAMAIEL
jgi:hypothetical protein